MTAPINIVSLAGNVAALSLDVPGIARISQRPIAKGRPGAMPNGPWDKLPERSGSIHHLRE
jgi:hypothetical protein